MMNIRSLYEISEITVSRKGMFVFSCQSSSSPSSELIIRKEWRGQSRAVASMRQDDAVASS